MNKKYIVITCVLCVFSAVIGYTASTVTIPYVFSAGGMIKADEVNANFQYLADQITALSSRVDKLEGNITAADLAGTYWLDEYWNGSEFSTSLVSGSAVHTGTLTLNNDGTGSYNVTTQVEYDMAYYLDNSISSKINAHFNQNNDTGSGSFTWSYSNGQLTIGGGGAAHVLSGGKMFIFPHWHDTSNTQNVPATFKWETVLTICTKKL